MKERTIKEEAVESHYRTYSESKRHINKHRLEYEVFQVGTTYFSLNSELTILSPTWARTLTTGFVGRN